MTEQVVIYQKTKNSNDYLPVQWYYDNYKDKWYTQLSDYMDRVTFEAEFDYKLSVAVGLFKAKTAKRLQAKNGYGNLGAFNGLFYKILTNWKSNVKSSAFRIKRRPSVQCPVCNRHIGRIDVEHLKHFKTTSDLPKFFVWKGSIYQTFCEPKTYAVTWGKNTYNKWKAMSNRDIKPYMEEKRSIRWPWRLKDGVRGVLCPFTSKVIPKIDDEYIRSLPSKYSRYADNITWEDFMVKYPFARIQSEILDLDKPMGIDEKTSLQDSISKDFRTGDKFDVLEYDRIKSGSIPLSYESVFKTIDDCVVNETDRDILKLLAAGHSVEDVSYVLDMKKKDIKLRIKVLKNDDLKQRIMELV